MTNKTHMSVRLTEKEHKTIDELKKFTGEKTATKAMLYAANRYPATVKKLEDTETRLQRALYLIDDYLTCRESVAEANSNLDKAREELHKMRAENPPPPRYAYDGYNQYDSRYTS